MIIRLATLRRFDAGTYRADVQLATSLPTSFDNIRVARNIDAAHMVAGRGVVIVAQDDNPKDSVLVGVFTP